MHKKPNSRGRFIVVEGGEGVGKSTNLAFIYRYLEQQQIDFIHTREPGGTPLAEEIRQLLLKNRNEKMHAMTELLLVFAARAQHMQQVILPALARGQWVIGDRFVDASYVYQGAARNLGAEKVAVLESLVLQEFKADLVIVLDVELAVSQARTHARGELDRFEQESLEFHQQVREAYLARAVIDPERYCVVNAGQTLERIQEELQHILDQVLDLSGCAKLEKKSKTLHGDAVDQKPIDPDMHNHESLG